MSEFLTPYAEERTHSLESNPIVELDLPQAIDDLRLAKSALENNQPTEFWRQCVRDASGRWTDYSGSTSRFGIKYFRGYQPTTDYRNESEVEYLRTSLTVRQRFYEGLVDVESMDVGGFQNWLELLRTEIQYRPTDEWLHQRFATPAHDRVVKEQVIPIAGALVDPYAFGITRGPIFDDIPQEALPFDEVEDDKIVHHYPTLDYSEPYLSAALRQIQDLMNNNLSKSDYIAGVANFYQLLINLHYFAAMNASLYMNMANGLLNVAGIAGIENGIVDFVALRLQPENFQLYFASEVSLEATRNSS